MFSFSRLENINNWISEETHRLRHPFSTSLSSSTGPPHRVFQAGSACLDWRGYAHDPGTEATGCPLPGLITHCLDSSSTTPNHHPRPRTDAPGCPLSIFIYNKVYNIIAIKYNNYILLVIKHYIIIKICKNTIYNYKWTLNNTLFCVFYCKMFGGNKFYHYLCNRKTKGNSFTIDLWHI